MHRMLATLQMQLRQPASASISRVLELDSGEEALQWLLGGHKQILPHFGVKPMMDDVLANIEVDPEGIPVLIRALELTAGRYFPEHHARDYVDALRKFGTSLALVPEDGSHTKSDCPLALESREETSAPQEALDKWGFIVAMFCTPSHRALAQRTIASCQQFGLPYTFHEVESIHVTLSPKASTDARFTKPNFIYNVLERWNMPVLYLDCDLIVMDEPWHLQEALREGADFAICNYFNDSCTAIFTPLERLVRDIPALDPYRYFKYTGQIPWLMPDQLFTNGAISWWNNSTGARALLSKWHQELVFFTAAVCHRCTPNPGEEGDPGVLTVAEDQVLDWVYNNRRAPTMDDALNALKPYWLPLSYARQPTYIYVAPIINHPSYPTGNAANERLRIPVAAHRELPKLHMATARRKDLQALEEHGLPHEAIRLVLDIKTRELGDFKPGGGFEALGPPLKQYFWPPEMLEWGEWPRPCQEGVE